MRGRLAVRPQGRRIGSATTSGDRSLSSRLAIAALLLAALGGCPPDTAKVDGAENSGFRLPPPLAETRPDAPPPEAAAIDPADWELPDEAGEPPHPPWLRLVYGQDNQAELEACGCPGQPSGGMARRATMAGDLRRILPDVLLVEGPTALSRAVQGYEVVRGEHRARAGVVLDALAASQPAAFFPGQADFAVLEPPLMAARARDLGLPLVATNLAPEVSAGFRPWVLRQLGDRQVLLLGLVRQAGSEERRRQAPVGDAVAAVAAAVEAARVDAGGTLDLVVAFCDGDLRDVERWQAGGLDVDVLLARPEPTEPRLARWQGDVLVVRADPLGRAFRRLDVAFSGPRGRGLAHSTATSWPVERVASTEEQYMRHERRLRGLEERLLAGEDPVLRAVGPDGRERVDPSTDPASVRMALAESKALRRQALAASDGLPSSGHAVGVSTIVIHPDVLPDASVERLLDEFAAGRLAVLRAQVPAPRQAPRSEQYLGRDGCLDCHPDKAADWARSPHAGAWKTLVERGETMNPDCLGCHTTGFGQPGGFVDPAADRSLLGVQCEACHGPMALHAEQAPRVGIKPDPGLVVDEPICVACHDEANSPGFDYAASRPKVDHSGTGVPSGAPAPGVGPRAP